MNISEAAEKLGISDSTIRKYLRDFGDIEGAFSVSAIPASSKHRRFTNHDLVIIDWIAKQYQDYNLTTESVRVALIKRLKDNTDFEKAKPQTREKAKAPIPHSQHEEVLAANQRALEMALAERDMMKTMLESERKTHREERKEWQAEIANLNREIGRLTQIVKSLGGDPDNA